MVDYGLKDRVALITGANNPQGIGATTAFAFAREGAKVVLVYKRIQDPLTRRIFSYLRSRYGIARE
jgi:3-oxoacyl-[acyl-carrier protein] reductase